VNNAERMYQTAGSSGRAAAKWHRLNAHGRAACTDLPVAKRGFGRSPSEVPDGRTCKARACNPQREG
jgi:hypothetical protein